MKIWLFNFRFGEEETICSQSVAPKPGERPIIGAGSAVGDRPVPHKFQQSYVADGRKKGFEREVIARILKRAGHPFPDDDAQLYQIIGELLQAPNSAIAPSDCKDLVNMLWHLTNEIEL